MAQQKQLDQARRLINAREYVQARTILRSMPDNPTAQEWLRKLDTIAPEDPFAIPEKRKAKPARRELPRVVVFIVGIVGGMFCGLLVAVGGNSSTAGTKQVTVIVTQPAVVQVVTATQSGPTPTITDTPLPSATFTATVPPTPIPPTATVAPLEWSGSGDQVIGPVTFPDGIYKATFVAKTIGSMNVKKLSGDCDLFALMMVSDFAGGKAESSFTFTGCKALLEVKTSEPWTLKMELVQ